MLETSAIAELQPNARPYKVAAGGGLYLLVNPDGGKWWRLKYRFGGREKSLSLGAFPALSLDQASTERDAARQLLDQDIDPGAARREAKARVRATALTGQKASASVVVGLDGAIEIHKGRALVCLSADEARLVREILDRLLGD